MKLSQKQQDELLEDHNEGCIGSFIISVNGERSCVNCGKRFPQADLK